ncbi:MAG TPA: hypothetical protein PKN96_01430 [Flavobacterium sp.]|uniref:hypothetical protein n=1 Tax=Flavobacterium sp. TaxID=239 RepID=UPI002B6EDE20|nr:hypothetical protein [Flavobacterium sp.]HNP31934.1 hypothetical protein [Flavobacterium sp.]
MKKIICFLIVSVTLTSCKIKDEEAKGETAQTQNKGFKVTVNVISKTTDDFCLLYTEDGTINFGKTVVWSSVPGNPEEQKVNFNLPEDVYPTELRFDLGLKQTATDTIYLKSLNFEYNGKKLDIVGAQLGQYFRADENHCKFDPTTGAIIPVVKDGKVMQASIYPQEIELGNALKKFGTQ